jgi:hypothetical protein
VEEPLCQIVGIVGDVHENGLDAQPQPAIFVPGAQLADNRRTGRSVAWVLFWLDGVTCDRLLNDEMGKAIAECTVA